MAPAQKRATQSGAGKQEEEQAAPHAKCQKTGAASDSAAVPVAGVAVERPGAGADPASESASPAIGGTSPGQPSGGAATGEQNKEEQAAAHAKRQKTDAASDSAAVPVAGVAVECPGAGADPASGAASPAIGGTSPGQPSGGVMEPAQCPQQPARSAGTDTWAKYYKQLAHFVRSRLPAELAKNCDMDIRQFGELHQCPCTDIKRNTKSAIGDMTTYKETWNVDNCITSMETTKKYEAAGNLFWFDFLCEATPTKQFGGQQLGIASEPHRSAVEGAASIWDDASYRSSALDDQHRRYTFPGVIPTACTQIEEARRTIPGPNNEPVPTFKNLPMLAGRACMLAWLEAVASCIQSEQPAEKVRLKKLFEAWATQFETSSVIYPRPPMARMWRI